MKRKKAALYNPYLDVLGGGEKHILSILQALEDEYDIHIFWDHDVTTELKSRLNISFQKVKFLPNIFKQSGVFTKLKTLSEFDLFMYVTDGSYFFSSAKKNYIFSMYPKKELYAMNFQNKLKTLPYSFIANSKYTQSWLQHMGIKSQVIYPYLDDTFIKFDIKSAIKENIILSVGRFFPHLHNKKHDVLIKSFLEIKKNYKEFKKFKLIIAGSLKEEDKEYFNTLKKMCDSSIELKPNISFKELTGLYKQASFYWHFAGHGVDETTDPELVEHLGVTPLEAMSFGCITCCYSAGGPKEIIKDEENGYLFTTNDELAEKCIHAMDDTVATNIQSHAKTFVQQNFNYEQFKNRVREVIL